MIAADVPDVTLQLKGSGSPRFFHGNPSSPALLPVLERVDGSGDEDEEEEEGVEVLLPLAEQGHGPAYGSMQPVEAVSSYLETPLSTQGRHVLQCCAAMILCFVTSATK